jgi:uncharacterized membrane protein YGL010W
MSDKTKIIIAVVLILSGILLFAIRIYEYKKDRKKAVLDEIVDSLVFFPLIDFLFPLGMIAIGIGWVVYLFKS